ncbi:TonB-dependent receptor domain-containing protein [Pseudocolwellia agarivorans]|uniref:TonB-dependent receptor domain-containing protein n=1 Tax=Pseudocolwellia agarivorans TaxID=1911682 RepID=UPI00098505D2|nr:TonB-dependent receptor [Pseudocolwellia agarivorans]
MIKINLDFTISAVARGVSLASVLTMAGTNLAFAQQDNQENAEEEAAMEVVLVTGSRIARSAYDSTVPVTSVGKETIEESGYANTYDILKSVPAIGVGLGSANAGNGGDATVGSSFINLRGLGVDRSLVLVNGRRRVSGSNTSAAVDITMIPAGLIKDIEVITGGASAVYGADAVSGVVNTILRDDIDGLELSTSYGASPEGSGGERLGVDLAGGTDFLGGRGSVVFGVSYAKENSLRADQRDFSSEQLNLRPNPLNTGPNDGISDNVHIVPNWITAVTEGGRFVVGGQQYTVQPDLRLLELGTVFGGGRSIGDADGFRALDYILLRQEQEVLATHVSMDFEINDNLNFFASVDYGKTDTTAAGQPENSFGRVVTRDNAFLQPEVAALMDANGLDSITVNRLETVYGNRIPSSDRTSYTIVTGLEGLLSNDWEWGIAAQIGSYKSNNNYINFAIDANEALAADAVIDPITGQPVCRSRTPGCVPIPSLGLNPISDEARAFSLYSPFRFYENKQDMVSATLTGDLFELPAGLVKFAGGLEYRDESVRSFDDPLSASGASALLRPVAAQNASQTVTEAYLETLVPLIDEEQTLDFEAAIRLSDYDTIGSTTAWRVGLNWAPIESVRVRSSMSTSVRAPNLSELFSAGSTSSGIVVDPCNANQITLGSATRGANCAALGLPAGFVDPLLVTRNIVTAGNPDLEPEESDSFSIGAVFTPSSIPNLTLSIDHWDIEIEDAIGSFAFADVLKNCVDSPTINNPFCSQITRFPSGPVESINLSKINVGKQSASGIDFQGRYNFDALNGNFDIVINGTYLSELEQLVVSDDPTSLVKLRNNPDNPDFRANFNISYYQGPLTLRLNTRYIGSAVLDPNARTNETIDTPEVNSKMYNDLVIGYEFENSLKLTATVSNLFSVNPPYRDGVWYGARGSYDNTGQFVNLRAQYTF